MSPADYIGVGYHNLDLADQDNVEFFTLSSVLDYFISRSAFFNLENAYELFQFWSGDTPVFEELDLR